MKLSSSSPGIRLLGIDYRFAPWATRGITCFSGDVPAPSLAHCTVFNKNVEDSFLRSKKKRFELAESHFRPLPAAPTRVAAHDLRVRMAHGAVLLLMALEAQGTLRQTGAMLLVFHYPVFRVGHLRFVAVHTIFVVMAGQTALVACFRDLAVCLQPLAFVRGRHQVGVTCITETLAVTGGASR